MSDTLAIEVGTIVGDRKKRSTSHHSNTPKIPYSFFMAKLPDGRIGDVVARGILDKDGAFYEMPDMPPFEPPTWLKLLNVEGSAIVYCPAEEIEIYSTTIAVRYK